MMLNLQNRHVSRETLSAYREQKGNNNKSDLDIWERLTESYNRLEAVVSLLHDLSALEAETVKSSLSRKDNSLRDLSRLPLGC